ncbi:MAG TPA: energy-coupling factor ABC transporter permease [Herpetosiphonaceae bacterium]
MLETLVRSLVLALHISDGLLSLPVSALFWLLTVASVGWAVRRTEQALDDRQVPLMGVMAACIFAAQMLNFPIVGGTSGHLLGGALAAIVLGPWAGVLVMTCVVALQALLFQDGGIVVMGANIFNMGVLTAMSGGAVFYILLRIIGRRAWGLVGSSFIAAWLTVVLSATMTSLQLIASSAYPASLVLPTMIGVHMLIGVGEGLITAAALSFLLATRPDILPAWIADEMRGTSRPLSTRKILGFGLGIAGIMALLSPFASSAPDGLEWALQTLGGGSSGLSAGSPVGLLPDYTIPGVGGGLSTILAGLVGVLIVVALGYGSALLIRRRRAETRATKSITTS